MTTAEEKSYGFDLGDHVRLTEEGRKVYGSLSDYKYKVIEINMYSYGLERVDGEMKSKLYIHPRYFVKVEKDKGIYFCKSCILEDLCSKKKIGILHLTGAQHFEDGKITGCDFDRQKKAVAKVSEIFKRRDARQGGFFAYSANEIKLLPEGK